MASSQQDTLILVSIVVVEIGSDAESGCEIAGRGLAVGRHTRAFGAPVARL
jgi:hypothetical protein